MYCFPGLSLWVPRVEPACCSPSQFPCPSQYLSMAPARGSSSSKKRPPSSSQARSYAMEVAVVTCVLSVTAYYLMSHGREVEAWLGAPHRQKAYRDFDSFYYKVYLKEHGLQVNRYLHFLGTTLAVLFLLTEPRLLACIPPAIAVGLNVFYTTLPLRHGLVEMLAMTATFMVTGRALTGTWTKPAAVLGMGYFWAWVGHFLVEHNRPSTFTYGTFSLIGDFRMWYRTLGEIRGALLPTA